MCLLVVIHNHIVHHHHNQKAKESPATMSLFICDLICPSVLPLIGAAREKRIDKV